MPTEHGVLQVRYESIPKLEADNPVLALGEPVLGIGPVPVLKFGDGVKHWKELDPVNHDAVVALEMRLTADEGNIDALIHRSDDTEGRLNDLTDATPAPYVIAGAYKVGDVVRRSGKTWLCIQDNNDLLPSAGSPGWADITLEGLHAATVALAARVAALEPKAPAPPPAPAPRRTRKKAGG